jgi:tetratricopeptide (TPR) repeat protein
LGATSPDAAAEAKQLARRSIVEYNGGDFEKALTDVKRAYDLDPAPGLLYNLGQCHRALHHWEQAEFFFKGYLRGRPGAANRTAVRALVDEMEKNRLDELAERKAAAPPPAQGRHIPASTWIFGAIGLAAGIAGAVAWGLVASDRSGYSTTGPEPSTVSYSGVQQSNTFATAGNILVPVGAGLIVIAAGIGIFGSAPASAAAP